MNAQQISWLPEEVRNHIAQLERDLARMEECLRNSGRNMDEAQEQIAGRDSKIVTLSADLTRVTAERDHWIALYKERNKTAAILEDTSIALRARVAELDKEAMILRGTVEAVTTQRQQAEQEAAR